MLPVWHPENFNRRKANLDLRQKILRTTRGYFAGQGFAEVETPILQISPGNEVHLQTFSTQMKGPHGDDPARQLFLHTSPEFAMKKLLVAGVTRLYQLAHVFRNGERSSRHHPEFTMLEWYRSREDGDMLDAIKQDCMELVQAAARTAGCATLKANDMVCDPFAAWETISMPAAFYRYTGIDLLATIDDHRAPLPEKLAKEAARIDIRTAADDRWEDIFFRILGERIEPKLGDRQPTFLSDYPISQAALARPKTEDARLAERFELYICGIELANAFGELTDAAEQARRFKADMDLKEKLYGERSPVDEDFLAALRHGMPEAAGIALGFDRLIMLMTGTSQIDDVLWLPVA